MKTITGVISFSLFVLFGNSISYGQADKPPFTSAVPKFTFSNTLAEQEKELESNPIIKRFAESRAKLNEDPYRPIFHFSSPEGRLGDPNGLCYWQGKWHLFYQGFPIEDSRQHWGHACSEDLVHWKDLPYAIYPNPERKVFSGATLVEDTQVIAMYHGTGEGNMIAVSDDPLLLNWEKILGVNTNAVIPTRSTTGFPLPYSVFDPCIWKTDGMYYSLAGGKQPFAGNKVVGAAYLFRSKDLKKWEFMHQFVEDDRFTLIGDDFACPYFWPIADRYIMIFFSHMSRGQFLLGDYDKNEQKFHVTGASGHTGYGPPSAAPDGKGGVIMLANIGGCFTIPRLLTLADDELHQEPVGDLASLRYDPKHLEKVQLPANKEIVLNNISGNAIEISAEIDIINSQKIEMNVLRSPRKEEFTKIVIYKEKDYNYMGNPYISTSESASMPADLAPLFTGEGVIIPSTPPRTTAYSIISIETDNSSSAPNVRLAVPVSASFPSKQGETLNLRIFIDKTIIEVFVNGSQALCASVRPTRKNSMGVSITSLGGDAELISLDAWQMKSIYNQ